MTTTTTAGPVDPIGADLHRTLKQLKLGQMTHTLPSGWSWPGSRR